MKLCSKEIQESPEKRMRRQRKSTVDVSGKEDALTLPRSRFGLILREPRRSVRNQPLLRQIVEVVLADRRPDPVDRIQPRGKPDRDEDPPRLDFFPFAFAVAFFACSRATVFSFPIAADGAQTEQRRWSRSRRSGEN